MSKIRIGQGFDAHKLVTDRKLILSGVEIPFDKGLDGHSDADVAAHAVIDAVLGAAALGDIGIHFPPGDPLYKDADSMELLNRVKGMAGLKGYRVAQVDVTIIAQAPKLAPYISNMRHKMADALRVPIESVSIKTTTTEGMGFTGRGEGIAAMAVALLEKI